MPSCSSKCCSTCWTMPQNMHLLRPRYQSAACGTAARSACRLWMKAAAFHLMSSTACSTSSIARKRAIMFDRVPALGSPSRVALLRPCTARFPPATAPTAAAPSWDHPPACSGGRRQTGHRSMNANAIRVLVIDDEPPIRKLLRMGLSTQGYDIIEAFQRQDCAGKTCRRSRADHPRSRPARY